MGNPASDITFLNREFERTVDDIQPFYQQLNEELLKTRLSLWIRKFHEKSADPSLAKSRNLYASLLLSMLRVNHVREPFLENPPNGPLLPLPDYHPGIAGEGASKANEVSVPHWLDDEDLRSVNSSLYSSVHLGSKFNHTPRHTDVASLSSVSLALPATKATKRPSPRKSSPTSRNNALQRRNSLSAVSQPSTQIITSRQQNCWDLESQTSTITISPNKVLAYVNGQQRHDRSRNVDEESREFELPSATFSNSIYRCTMTEDDLSAENEKLPVREAILNDQRVKLEAKHDVEIKRLLDKKNSEAEELRAYYRSKLSALESERDKIKDRLSAVVAELEEVKRDKRSEADAVRNVMMEAIDAKQAECDRAVEQALSQTTAERNVLQRQQAAAIQQLLDDTQARLQRVESEYREQCATATQMASRLEETVRELTVSNGNLLQQRNELEQRVNRLQPQLNENEQQLDAVRAKFSELQDAHFAALKRYEEQLNELQAKAAENEDLLRQELERAADAHESEKRAAESAIDDLRLALNETQGCHQRDVEEVEQRRHRDIKAMQDQFELKFAELAQEMDLERAIAEKKIARLEIELGERDRELVAVVDRCRLESTKNERQIEDFRAHIEQTTLRALTESRAQFNEMEKELVQVKRDLKQVTAERDQLKSAMEQLRSEHEHQIEDLVRAHAAELAIIRQSAVHEREAAIDELRVDYDRRVREANNRLHQVESDMASAETEWKTRTSRLVEQAAAEARREQRDVWEQQRTELVKAHDTEMASASEQWTAERKKLCAQLDDRMVAENATRELRDNELVTLRNELNQLRELRSCEAVETARRWSSELQRLQADVNTATAERDAIQREFRLVKVQHEQKLREIAWSSESRLAEMLPANVRSDLEATIEALRNQVRHHEQTIEALRARLALRQPGGGSGAGSGVAGSIFSDNAPTSGLGSEHGDSGHP